MKCSRKMCSLVVSASRATGPSAGTVPSYTVIKLVTSSCCGLCISRMWAATGLPCGNGRGWTKTSSSGAPAVIRSTQRCLMSCSHLANWDVNCTFLACQQTLCGGSDWSTNHVVTSAVASSPSQLKAVRNHSSCKSWMTSGIASIVGTPGTNCGASGLNTKSSKEQLILDVWEGTGSGCAAALLFTCNSMCWPLMALHRVVGKMGCLLCCAEQVHCALGQRSSWSANHKSRSYCSSPGTSWAKRSVSTWPETEISTPASAGCSCWRIRRCPPWAAPIGVGVIITMRMGQCGCWRSRHTWRRACSHCRTSSCKVTNLPVEQRGKSRALKNHVSNIMTGSFSRPLVCNNGRFQSVRRRLSSGSSSSCRGPGRGGRIRLRARAPQMSSVDGSDTCWSPILAWCLSYNCRNIISSPSTSQRNLCSSLPM